MAQNQEKRGVEMMKSVFNGAQESVIDDVASNTVGHSDKENKQEGNDSPDNEDCSETFPENHFRGNSRVRAGQDGHKG